MLTTQVATSPRPGRAGRWGRLAPYFLIGPISGSLVAGIVINFRAGNHLLSSLYAIALVLFVVEMPIIAARIL